MTKTLSMKTRLLMVVAALALALLSASAVSENALALPNDCVSKIYASCGGGDMYYYIGPYGIYTSWGGYGW